MFMNNPLKVEVGQMWRISQDVWEVIYKTDEENFTIKKMGSGGYEITNYTELNFFCKRTNGRNWEYLGNDKITRILYG